MVSPGLLERFDTIHDFETGIDKINLSAVDGNALLDGHQPFYLVFSPVHSTVVGDLTATHVGGGEWTLTGKTDGDAWPDFMIRINQADPLASFTFDDVILL